MTKNIVLLASGNGTNVERIVTFFGDNPRVNIQRIYCNKPDAFVIQRAKRLKIPVFVFTKLQFNDKTEVLRKLQLDSPDLIVLAGFLWLIPQHILRAFPNKIINIHPALLPAYGGKGMYGSRVHEAVIRARDKESGISIHYVNAKFDDGEIIFQARCPIQEGDTPEILAQHIHELEYEYFPKVIESLLM